MQGRIFRRTQIVAKNSSTSLAIGSWKLLDVRGTATPQTDRKCKFGRLLWVDDRAMFLAGGGLGLHLGDHLELFLTFSKMSVNRRHLMVSLFGGTSRHSTATASGSIERPHSTTTPSHTKRCSRKSTAMRATNIYPFPLLFS